MHLYQEIIIFPRYHYGFSIIETSLLENCRSKIFMLLEVCNPYKLPVNVIGMGAEVITNLLIFAVNLLSLFQTELTWS
jgi:hypothetical protein